MWLIYCFNIERNHDVLKSESPCFLLNENLNVNKNETELKKEKKSTHTFREASRVLQLIKEYGIKSKTVMS